MELNHKVKMSIDDWRDFQDDEDVSLAYGKVTFLSTKPNSHQHVYTEEVLQRDAKTFLGKFLITDYDEFAMDSTTHTENQKIVGYIPTNQEVLFDRDEEDYLQATVDVVVSKVYATEVYKMFKEKNFRAVSVESLVGFTEDTRDFADGEHEKIVEGFEGIGVTILGLRYKPSVPTANISLTKMSADDINVIEKEYKKYSSKESISMSQILEKLGDIENEIKNLNQPETVKFAIEIGSTLWEKIYRILIIKYPHKDFAYESEYSIKGIFEEENREKYVVLENSAGMYKVELKFKNGEVELSEDFISVEMDFVESDKVNKYSEEEVTKFKEKFKERNMEKEKLEEENKEQKEMAENVAEEKETKEEAMEKAEKMEKDSENDDDKEDKEDEDNDDEDDKKESKMSELETEISELKNTIAVQLSELESLRQFKASVNKEKKDSIVSATLLKAKEYVSQEEYDKFAESAKVCEYENITGWKNQVLASITDTVIMSNKEEDGIMDMGLPKDEKVEESIFD